MWKFKYHIHSFSTFSNSQIFTHFQIFKFSNFQISKMFFKKKQPENYLTFIPVRKIKEFSETEGKITLLIPKFKNEGLRKWLVPNHKSAHIKIHLDENGSNVWRLIDDRVTVE